MHPTEEDYNDVAPWNYAEILNVFDANRKYSRSFRVKTGGELTSLLQSDDFLSYSGVQVRDAVTCLAVCVGFRRFSCRLSSLIPKYSAQGRLVY